MKKPVLLVVALVLMAGSVIALQHLKTHQHLGVPGIKAAPTTNGVVMQIELPAKVLDFWSTNLPESDVVTNMLPSDTSYAQRAYTNAESMFPITANIILMGKDRTSIHKPEFCLPGQGLKIVSKTNEVITVPGSPPYQMTIARWTVSKTVTDAAGRPMEIHALYVFWFVADNEIAQGHLSRTLYLWRDLLTKGILQRWAYVSYFTYCFPGQEDAAFDRVKRLIAESVPQFQLPPKSARPTAMLLERGVHAASTSASAGPPETLDDGRNSGHRSDPKVALLAK